MFERIILKKNMEINYLKNKLFRGNKIEPEVLEQLKYILNDLDIIIESINYENNRRLKYYTKEEVAKYDGKNGTLAYIIIYGTIYDITGVKTFSDNKCNFIAGTDGTDEFKRCLNGDKNILNNLRVVGVLSDTSIKNN